MNDIRSWRILLKAIFLYVIANVAFAYFDPPLGKLTFYNWLIPGRERVPYEREIEYYPFSHTIPVYEDMDAMYSSHILSQPKQADEFRIVLVGDSSAWGFELHPEDTLAGKLTALNLKTCEGKRIMVYNAAFPLPYVMKDLLIMDKVREYDPDMYLWTITLDAMRNRTAFSNYFLNPYAERVSELVDEYGIKNLDTEKMSTPNFWTRTIIGQRSRLKKDLLLQFYGFGWAGTGLDYYYNEYSPYPNDQTNSLLFEQMGSDEFDLDLFLFDVLKAGYELTDGTPLLVINEPIFISSGENSDIRYNFLYPRWAYDGYRAYLANWMRENDHEYVDAWNVVPLSDFTDSIFHRTPDGEEILAALLKDKIIGLACTR
jgi:hypothetical protein